MPLPATTILFDLDGTLTDPVEGTINSVRYALERMGRPCPSPEEIASHIGPPLQLLFAALLGSDNKELIDEAMRHYRQRYSVEGKGMVENRLYPGIRNALERLQAAGKKLYVATSKPTTISQQITAHFDIDRYFVAVYGSELDGTRSNKGDLIAWLLSCENLSPEQVIMIGDRKHDIIGASRNNVRGIGALWGYGSAEEMSGAIALAQTPEDLSQLIVA